MNEPTDLNKPNVPSDEELAALRRELEELERVSLTDDDRARIAEGVELRARIEQARAELAGGQAPDAGAPASAPNAVAVAPEEPSQPAQVEPQVPTEAQVVDGASAAYVDAPANVEPQTPAPYPEAEPDAPALVSDDPNAGADAGGEPEPSS